MHWERISEIRILSMDEQKRRIINQLQGGFPLTPRPFADAARALGMEEEELIQEIIEMPATKVPAPESHASPPALIAEDPMAETGGPKEGDKAPAFTLETDVGEKVKLSDLKGKKVVVYFYPKDDTPGCTVEACAFRDNLPAFTAGKAAVLGVSILDEKSKAKFAKKHGLTFPLLADADNAGLEGRIAMRQRTGECAAGQGGVAGGMADDPSQRLEEQVVQCGHGVVELPEGILSERRPIRDRGSACVPGPTNGHWRDADWLFCRDGKWRPVEPGTFPLAHGAASRVGRLRAYGNAIVPQVAQTFIEAYLET